jgi:hypothetical protein
MIAVQSHRIRREGRVGLGVDAFFAMACAVHVLAVADAWASVDWERMSGHMRCYQTTIVALSTALFLLFMGTEQAPTPGQPEDKQTTVLPPMASCPPPGDDPLAVATAGTIARRHMHLL